MNREVISAVQMRKTVWTVKIGPQCLWLENDRHFYLEPNLL